MTGPQIEDGYTRIANQLLEQILLYPFSKRQLIVMLAIIRKTYGYGKKTDDMTVTQIASMTRIARQHVSATISELEAIGAVLKQDGHYGYRIGIQKDYSQWGLSQNRTCPETVQKVSQNRTVSVPKQDTQKKTPKENTKDIPPLPPTVCQSAWAEFAQHRKDIRKPLTQLAATKTANLLAQYPPEVQQQMVDDSIRNGWRGVFPPKGGTHATNQPPHRESAVERVRRKNREREQAEGGITIDGGVVVSYD